MVVQVGGDPVAFLEHRRPLLLGPMSIVSAATGSTPVSS